MPPSGGFALAFELTRDEAGQAIGRVVEQRRHVAALVFDPKLVAVVELHGERAALLAAHLFEKDLHRADSVGEA